MVGVFDPAGPLTISGVLRAAFPESDPATESAKSADSFIHVIPQGLEPRWIIIGDPRKAVPVLRSWRPYNLGSRVRWGAVVSAASLDVLARLPGVVNSRAPINLSYWQRSLAGFSADWTPVVHVGNPSHTRKAIVFFIGQNQIKAVAKVPLIDDAAPAILNEAEILRGLHPAHYLPEVLFADPGRGIAAQSWLEGKPVSRELTAAHVNLLGLLALPGSTTRLADYRTAITADLEQADLPFDRTILARAMDMLDFEGALPGFVEHRDFAPWNLKRMPNGETAAIDWEWAVARSLPCQDICRFFYIQDALFDGPGKVWETLTGHPLLQAHYRRFSISPHALPSLTMHYLLRVLCMDWRSGNARLAHYAFRQIDQLLRLKKGPK
jgi:hypothetical protein